MSEFYVERQGWQRWPKVLVMVKKNGHGDERKRYVPERTCRNAFENRAVGTHAEGFYQGCFECSLCGCSALGYDWQSFHIELEWNFCPNCGARVKED